VCVCISLTHVLPTIPSPRDLLTSLSEPSAPRNLFLRRRSLRFIQQRSSEAMNKHAHRSPTRRGRLVAVVDKHVVPNDHARRGRL
jgi:hypothetical protein